MPKKQPAKKFNTKAFLKITLPALCGLVVVLGVIAYSMFRPVIDNPTSIREALINAASAVNRPAAVEPRTGDVYFPEAKLYIPRGSDDLPELTYRYDHGYIAQDGREIDALSVSSRELFAAATSDLYNASDSAGVFAKVPRLQACQRAIAITSDALKDTEGRKLHHRLSLEDGRTIYMYIEPSCSGIEFDSLLKSLNALRSYQ